MWTRAYSELAIASNTRVSHVQYLETLQTRLAQLAAAVNHQYSTLKTNKSV